MDGVRVNQGEVGVLRVKVVNHRVPGIKSLEILRNHGLESFMIINPDTLVILQVEDLLIFPFDHSAGMEEFCVLIPLLQPPTPRFLEPNQLFLGY